MNAWAFDGPPQSRVLTLLAATLALWLVALPAGAQAASELDRATARDLGKQGLAALDARNYPIAVERLSRAIALYDAPTLRLARARAERGLGKLVAASEDLQAVLRWPVAKSDPPAFVTARNDAERELKELEPKIPRLTLVVTGSPRAVRVDGVEWPTAALGVARPVDPGEHRVEVEAAVGHKVTRIATLAEGQSLRFEVATPEPPRATQAPAPAAPAPVEPVRQPAQAPPPAAPAPAAPTGSRTSAYVVGGAAVVFTAAAVVTGLLALNRRSEFNDENRADVPSSDKEDLHDSAVTMSWISTGLTAAAVVSGGLATYLFVAPTSTETAGPGGSAFSGAVVGLRGGF